MESSPRPADVLEEMFKSNPTKVFCRNDFGVTFSKGQISSGLRALLNRKIIRLVDSRGVRGEYQYNL